jgi:hypothetical protein
MDFACGLPHAGGKLNETPLFKDIFHGKTSFSGLLKKKKAPNRTAQGLHRNNRARGEKEVEWDSQRRTLLLTMA